MVYITEVHMSGGSSHEHIAEVRWYEPSSGKDDRSSRSEMVDWILNKGGDARVKDYRGEVQVKVVRANPPYLRTYADNRPTDNLLSLPRY
ncbi:DUF3892 domain-containing protein [Archangium lansingense]|uniref:DUF3892 domain-containing protein n=1 Tax=Archangium lansingense TaxID=2995310 RepID=A0ABT3ZZB6_9BACT|nr:DUF3892 domain-containing protein [Archangium lansinium]MCY1074744.1 DUF3892 domain-containing protein [Archangium lansinium]